MYDIWQLLADETHDRFMNACLLVTNKDIKPLRVFFYVNIAILCREHGIKLPFT